MSEYPPGHLEIVLSQTHFEMQRMKRERDEARAAGRELAEAVEKYGGWTDEADAHALDQALARYREIVSD